ncbi:hypothetical protein GGR54DRAFT_625468 [Hypoxylon sp. NC1633]|nr:hypothetical protein GGR54DRAFT_625468 [Hypoxylon sp. NC1633]
MSQSASLEKLLAAFSQPKPIPMAPIDKCPLNVLPLLPPKQEIIDRCIERWNISSDHETPNNKLELELAEGITIFIKFGPPSLVDMHEAYTQDLMHNLFKNHPTVRVLPVWLAFMDDAWTFVIMPHLVMYSTDVSQTIATPSPEECADAVVAITQAEVPSWLQAQAPGAIGGGPLRLHFFREIIPRKKHANLDELAEDVTKLSQWRVPVKFDQHEMRFYYVDVNPENFCRISNLTIVLDFGMAGLAPIEFQIVDMLTEHRSGYERVAHCVLEKLGREKLRKKETRFEALREDQRLWAVKTAWHKS